MNIDIKGLVKTYRNKKVLSVSDFNFSGEKIYGITGPNGAGKTTLLKIIAGVECYDAGEIRYDQEMISRDLMQKMTYVSQQPYMFKSTVYENIEYPLKLRKISKEIREERVTAILDRLKIYELKDRMAHQLSAGETQKVALGRAVVFKPKILLLDEPTANIDSKTLSLIESLLKEYVQREKMMVLHISHFESQIDRLCDKVITMAEGEIVALK